MKNISIICTSTILGLIQSTAVYAGREEAIDALARRLEHGATVAVVVAIVLGIYYFFKK